MRLPAYPEYKPSDVEWLGDVPAHWEVKRLKMVVQPTDRKVEADEEHPMPYVGMENIESWTGRLLLINLDGVSTGTANEFKAGNTLFGKLRPYLAKACNPDFDGLCSTELLVLKSADIDRRTLLYSLLSDGFIKLVDSSTYGSKMPRASWDFIGNCVLPIAHPSEQRAIAEFLDRETAKIDMLMAKKRTLIERLKEKRTALISRTVTQGLLPDDACAAGLKPHRKLKPTGLEWLGEVPEHWDVKRLKDAGRLLAGSGFPHDFQGAEGEALQFYKVGDLVASSDGRLMGVSPNTVSFETAEELRARVIPAGSVVYAKIGAALLLNRRRITSIQCCIDNNMTAYVPRTHIVLSAWAFYCTLILDFGKFANPGAIPSLSESDQAVLPILLPSKVEQRAIVAYLDRETRKIDSLVAKIETAIERLQEYRTALITAAVTGKIDVGEAAA